MGRSADLVVLGAGPSGLAAAWRAARRGLSVVVLERAGHVGGLSASFEVAGVRVDHGSHRLHPATPPHLMADLRGLLGDDLQTRPRNGRLRIAGRFVGFPLRAGELARRLPPGLLAGVARDTVAAPLRGGSRTSPAGGGAPGRADTYAGALRASLGPALYDALYAPYAVKLWGLPGEEIDGDQARKRVTADSPWKIARRILRGQSNGQGKIFHYPRRGFGQIVDALAEAATAAGAEIRLGTACTRIEPAEDSVVVHTSGEREAAAGDRIEAGRVFSTIPMPALARLVRPGPPEEVVRAAGRLAFRAMTLVYAVHEGGRWTPYDAHYLPGPETPVTRISEPANYRISADDPAGRTVLCFEIPCAAGDEIWTTEDFSGLVRETLAVSGLPPVDLADVVVRRVPHVYPVYETGYAAHLAGLDAWAGTVPNVTTFGRLGLFAHDNTHHAMAMGYDAVDSLTSAGWDVSAWRAARSRFAEHVVED
ncbi:FAD-dependent oxidoreductase [Planomonospora sp. ID67723]|uniref:FAD-dependent oxidoreductase n=1 Tax=Planomonospora sp. ID67723 TaxID=2738134 RepID=UPI0018C37FAD|nr:FAD-dependent oxidoreductase [Planomonospora sp. ID67723]MBG0832240.1 FAD-dependent oxidoreductase [Planomonospora sp. ID67723]